MGYQYARNAVRHKPMRTEAFISAQNVRMSGHLMIKREAQLMETLFKDTTGNVLNDGDKVIVIKDLKVKWFALVLKVGTKVKNIRLVDGDHDIDCKIDGIGVMKLKSQFVKKA